MMLETERLLLRDFVMEDWQHVHVYASDPAVAVHMLWGPNTEADTRGYLELMADQQSESPRKAFELAVVLKATNTLIGGCGLHIAAPHQGEIGYCFNPQYWGNGFASEAASALLAFGFDTLDLNRIYATCRPANTASANVMKRLGMTYEGHLREHLWAKGKWHDSYLHSILKKEYQ
ncbi:RimJ/RimL family protein N-acetyltransferase [Paenibacillus phyllosphaerae]|uniref:RimJ/RimL family protein N-acetyltransferase n=1 Tax=Paenibacillus phyllosphaerae TaxID=274593 RepID=A0A7W5AWK5_9BACL|nr:GNAT family protein [Paenibacillus phyllosphaerae]MBB3110078.1 RimJ/RimL family protein N-acetyltransferase [Paenibacillus phyllosphaerae]